MQRSKTGGGLGGAKFSRKDFLQAGGAGLAGAALLGTGALAGCGGSGSGSNENIFSWGPDDTGVLPKLIETFNKQSGGLRSATGRCPPTPASTSTSSGRSSKRGPAT